jgi:nicotinamidase-related amidase
LNHDLFLYRHRQFAVRSAKACLRIRAACCDAISLDYAVTVLSDCTSSKTPEIQESNLRDMANVGAVIASSKEIIEES